MRGWLLAGFVGLLATGSLIFTACGEEEQQPSADIALQTAAVFETRAAEHSLPTALFTAEKQQTPTTPTPKPANSPTPSPTPLMAGANQQLLDFLQALRQRDRDRLRDLIADRVRQQVNDQQIQQLADCVPQGATVSIVDQDIKVEGNNATVDVVLQMESDSGTQRADLQLKFELTDGAFRLTEVPDCPFQS